MIHCRDDFYYLYANVECLVFGNGCLNTANTGQKLEMVSFSLYENVRVIDVGYDSWKHVKSVNLSSLLFDD